MKKVFFVAIACITLLFVSCKHNIVTTQYTIGCLGYSTGSLEYTNWNVVTQYFESHVEYNKIVTYENSSLAENDLQAKNFFQEQIEKLDTAYICSLLTGNDFFIYGIATINADNTYRIISALKFNKDGVETEP